METQTLPEQKANQLWRYIKNLAEIAAGEPGWTVDQLRVWEGNSASERSFELALTKGTQKMSISSSLDLGTTRARADFG